MDSVATRVDGRRVGVARTARQIAIRGVVQGVGFRPFVYRLAQEYALSGWVRNTSGGVEIEVEGSPQAIEAFVADLPQQAPPLAHIESLKTADVPIREVPAPAHREFRILHSEAQAGSYQLISPDIATCPDCLRELLDPANRRYRYPFTNCTNCGPRFTIIADVPYDRELTTMRSFRMCDECQQEYDDPLDRRFHAQPNACPVCGPQVALLDRGGKQVAGQEALSRAAELLRRGAIVAIKGLGGYQLACDATDAAAVARLRERKRRPHKPFAVMLADMDAVLCHTRPSAADRELLGSVSAPIVLAPWRHPVDGVHPSAIVEGVAPRHRYLGVMLPYTPLHHILLREAAIPLVMTSGNLSEEPIARDNDEALRRLGHIADYFLVHNRDIYARYDDSVWFVTAAGSQPVRRARGYAPSPIRLPFETRPILACGPELKNTFCLTRERYAFVSQHIGDMANWETLEHYRQSIELLKRLFHVEPEVVAVDMHPDYMSTRYGLEQPGPHGCTQPHVLIRQVRVQHHHAHLASCLADTGHQGPAIGVILDGTGYGLDGSIWGGEFLVGDARGFQRAAHLAELPLPGGDQAVRKPYRIALAYLAAALGPVPLPDTLSEVSTDIPIRDEQAAIQGMIATRTNTPWTSSAGRLFDAVAALLGVCQEVSYEAQAAIELEMVAGDPDLPTPDVPAREVYPFDLQARPGVQSWGRTDTVLSETLEIGLAPLLAALLADLRVGRDRREIALQFHRTVSRMVVATCARLGEQTGLRVVALSGGCFQNRLLLSLLIPELQSAGFDVLTHNQVPCNDGGVALGQAVVAHHAMEREA